MVDPASSHLRVFTARVKLILLTAGLAIFIALAPPSARAATIRSLKGRRALITFDTGESFRIGQTVGSQFPDGTRKSELVIIALKKHRAVAELRSGDPEEGDAVRVITSRPIQSLKPTPAPTPTHARARPKPHRPRLWSKYGVLSLVAGLSSDSQSVHLTGSTSVQLKGLAPFVRGSLVRQLKSAPRVGWELGVSLDRIETAGSTHDPVCGGAKNCDFNLTGLAPFARASYTIAPRLLRLGVKAGFDTFIPVSVTSNIVDAGPFLPLFFASAGLSLKIGLGETHALRARGKGEVYEEESYIPISVEYLKYIGNVDVALSRIQISAGYSWR